jgi:hypothetical protein
MALTLVLIDVDFQLSRHRKRFPSNRRGHCPARLSSV